MDYWHGEGTLEAMDSLKALRQNAQLTIATKDRRKELILQAVKERYSNVEIGKALGVTEAAVRMYRSRHDLQ